MFTFFFFFNDTATTEIYTLSLHDALPISTRASMRRAVPTIAGRRSSRSPRAPIVGDRKSTRLNSSHTVISYAVFCLKKKKNNKQYNLSIVINNKRSQKKQNEHADAKVLHT